MTQDTTTGLVPQWDLSDRMRKALQVSELGVAEIADYLGVSRTTVSNWINGRIRPSRQTQRLWALKTGVDYDWLTGRDSGGEGDEEVLPRKDSNLQPFENGPTPRELDWLPSWHHPDPASYGLAA